MPGTTGGPLPPTPPDPTGGLRRAVRAGFARRAPEDAQTGTVGGAIRVGLLGGSFNPAHDGHLYITREAAKRLRLDQVWWLVSPQNPLKPVEGMAPLVERLESARVVARDPRIKVRALETRFGTRYSVDTLERLARWPRHRFIWLIGADNLAQLPRWRRWSRIFELVPMAVVERAPWSHRSQAGAAAQRYPEARLLDSRAVDLATSKPPAWAFLRLRPHPASSTAIRSGLADTPASPPLPSTHDEEP